MERIKELVDKLNKATEAYDLGKPYMTDKEWDDMFFTLEHLERQKGIVLENSPTRIIYPSKVSSLHISVHNHAMLSLQKTKSVDELKDFIGGHPVLLMCKMDGLTCSLRYVNGELVCAETRGDGRVGENIFHNALVIPSIPKHIPYKEELVVDGEIICTYQDFEEFKDEYKNPRNFAAGSIRLLDSDICKSRKLTFVAWDVIQGFEELPNLRFKLSELYNLNFSVVPYSTYFNLAGIPSSLELDFIIANLKDVAVRKGYPIDGIVAKYDIISYGKSLGATAHHFNNAIAYKFYDEAYTTKILDIEYTMGRSGILTPVAILEPVEIDGSEVSRASLHNISVMKATLGEMPYYGQQVEVFKANMIIPQIQSAIPWDEVELQEGEQLDGIAIPCTCPICQQILKWNDNDGVITLSCENPQCKGKFINRLDHFCSKKGLDIKGLSKATLEKLIDWGYVNELDDLFNLDMVRDPWMKKPGFGEKSVNKILSSIDAASQNATLEAVISAIGIPLIGRTVSKDLAKRFKTYENFRKHINEGFNFMQIDGYGPEMNKALLTFDYKELDFLVDNYIKINEVEVEEPEEDNANNSLNGLTFVITGKLKTYKNRDALKAEIETRGGKVAGSVSKNTNYLINNDSTSNSAKNLSAQKLGVAIITEAEFKKLFDI